MSTNNSNPNAVVTELGIAGLSIVRSLGKKGIPVIGIDSKLTNYGALSKYCKPVFCRNVNDYSLVETLLNLGKNLDHKAVLFPASDLSALIISEHRDELEEFYLFVLPPREVIETLMNKRMFHQFAVKYGLPVPNTIFSYNAEQLKQAASNISYPCVIKPQIRDDYWFQHVPLEYKVIFIPSENEYLRVFSRYDIADRPLIIEEWIHGKDDDVYFCLTYIDRDYNPLAIFTGKTVRLYPTLTGYYTLAESHWDSFVAEESLKLLRLSGCKGLCSVEFKFCHKHKTFKITEPTVARVDMQESMATACGIDIPYIAYLDATGVKQVPSSDFKTGVKWICETVEIYSVRRYLKEKGVKQLLSTYSGKRAYALMNVDDPLPFIHFITGILRKKISSILKIGKKRK